MNTKELTRRRELCSSLNIDFDEASELFSDETLESMQMAKVSGGSWIYKLIEIIVVAGVTYFSVRDEDGATKEIKVPVGSNGEPFSEFLNQPSDSTFVILNSDGSVVMKRYGTGGSTPTGGPTPPSPSSSN